ncbi:MAG: discoidin domain-containing protein [Prevotella sp.]|nr:discoidin domain-containing protein [Prevotella sp.]
MGTNWNTEAVQTSGQWYQVGFYRDETFNTVILIAPNGQGPADYKVEVSSDAKEWTLVKTGKDAGSMAVITFNTVTAKYVRITQMGSKNAKWGISEFKIALLKEGQLSGINHPETAQGDVVYHDQCLYFKGNMIGSSVAVYAVTGVCVLSVPSAPAKVDLSPLSKGQYLVSVRDDQMLNVKRIKVIR